jgi:hypothetical protein
MLVMAAIAGFTTAQMLAGSDHTPQPQTCSELCGGIETPVPVAAPRSQSGTHSGGEVMPSRPQRKNHP